MFETRHRARRVVAVAVGVSAAALLLVATAGKPAGAGAAGTRTRSGVTARPQATGSSLDPYGSEGMNVDAAQSGYTEGDPNVIVAYIEGGINWHGDDASGLADSVYVNWRELPVPCTGDTMVVGGETEASATDYSSNEDDYDLAHPDCVENDDCDVTAADWANDPRVGRQQGISFITPEDLIAAFSGAGYDPPTEDPAGYSHAISGWDFYDGQNDPATVDGSYQHANDQMATILRICPDCTILPVKAGDEAIDDTDDLAQAWLFAAESGARVIVSVTADLGYSTFAREVLTYVESKGIVVVDASNDFDSPDHQGGMYWNGVLAGNGLVANTDNLPESVWSLPTVPGPEWTRSDLTSWGPHAEFSVATQGGSTSESTPTLGGVVALLLSYGDEAYAKREIPAPLTGPEAVAVLQSASSEPSGAPSGSWDEDYGYGMPDVLSATQAIAAGNVPPAASITSPTWYKLFDPTRTKSVAVKGSVSAEPGQDFTWQLQYGLGGDPQGSAWHTIASGSATGSFSGTFGTFDLSLVPKSFWGRAFHATPTGEMTSLDEYTVTFRVVASATGSSGTLSDAARMAVSVFHDPTALPGFPLQLSSSGESQPALADLQGNGRLDIIFGTADGDIDAIDPKTGRELPGWPAHTDALHVAPVPAGSGIHAGDEAVISDVAVGDLFHTGQLDVVATSASGHVYAFDAEGKLLPGWPKTLSKGVVPPAIPRPEESHVRLPVLGASAPPVLAPLQSGGKLNIVQAGWDGYLFAWSPAGKVLPGWPVQVGLPAGTKPPANDVIEEDHKLDTPPAVAWLSKSSTPNLVIRSQYTEFNPSQSPQELVTAFTFAYSASGKLVAGWPVKLTGALEDYGSAMEFVTEGTDAPVAADVLGNGTDQVAVNPVWTPPYLVSGSGRILGSYGSLADVASTLEALENDPLAAVEHKLPPGTTDVPIPFASSGAFGKIDGKLVFTQPEMGSESLGASILYPGTGNHVNEYASAWPANVETDTSGKEVSGYPSAVQGDAFLAEPIITPVSGGGTESIVVGGDASAVSAVLPDGKEAPGFPKYTGGWTTYAPASGDLFGTGTTDLVTTTREGYLFAWSTGGSGSADDQWWRAFHDEWNSSNYDLDTRPPGVVRDPVWVPGSGLVSFVAPGANWYDGTVAHYDVTLSPSGKTEQVAGSVPAGSLQSIAVPAGTTAVTIQAVNKDGLLGGTVKVTPGIPGLKGAPSGKVVGMAATPDGAGWWLATSTGAVYAFGDARYHGGDTATASDPVVGIAAAPGGGGYWLATAGGSVLAYGDARDLGSPASLGLRLPAVVVGIAAAPDGQGYWLASSNGGVFSFGSARFHGSAASARLNAPVVAIAPTPYGAGYWLAASDGGVFGFGDARFHGSEGGKHLASPIVGMAAAPDGKGYWLVAGDGAVYSFGVGFAGSAGGTKLAAPVTAIVATPPEAGTGSTTGAAPGYRLAGAGGAVYTFGPSAAG